jgi:hypothetical protein
MLFLVNGFKTKERRKIKGLINKLKFDKKNLQSVGDFMFWILVASA